MATMEKLIKTLEQLKSYDFTSADALSKKKDCRVQLFNVTELMCNPSLQTHTDFVNYIGPGIATLIKLCDVPDSDIRLASDEGLCRVIKVLMFYFFNGNVDHSVCYSFIRLYYSYTAIEF